MTDASRPPLPRNVKAVGAVSFLQDAASEIIHPILPLFLVTSLGAPVTIVGLIEGLADAAASIGKAVSGYASDRLRHRKAFILLGYATSGLAKPLLALAGTWPFVLALRFMDRTGKGVRGAPRDALIADSTPPGVLGRAFGLHRALDTAGAVVGSAIAFLLLYALPAGEGTYRMAFLIAGIPAVASLVVILLYVREPPSVLHEPRGPPRASLLSSEALSGWSADLKRFFVASALFSLANLNVAFFLLRARDAGLSPVNVVLVYVLFNVVYALVAFPAGTLSDRTGRRPLLLGAYVGLSAVSLGFAFAQSWLPVVILFVLLGVYTGVFDGAQKAYAAELAPRASRATVLGLHGMLTGVLALGSGLLAGLLYDLVGPRAAFLTAAALSLVAFLVLLPRARVAGVTA